jgi:ankyrin repeat protein/tetratricopeptide (TPR) repeat protein
MNSNITPIPQPAEIVAFLIQNFSIVDYQTNEALKKKLQRLSAGKPLSVDASMELIEQHLSILFEASGHKFNFIRAARNALDVYIKFIAKVDCGALPFHVVRTVFDRIVVAQFADQFKICLPELGLSGADILGQPDTAISKVWKAYTLERSEEDYTRPLLKAGVKAEGSWGHQIREWIKNGNMDVRTILKIAEKSDFNLGYALLLARAYRKYCKFSLVDPASHKAPFLSDINDVQWTLNELSEGTHAHCGSLSTDVVQYNQELVCLLAPQRKKVEGDADRARHLVQLIEAAFQDEPRVAGLGWYKGKLAAQLGNLKEALDEFDRAAGWFCLRSGPQFKSCLHYLINTSAALGEREVRNRWIGWASTLGLETSLPSNAVMFLRDFPHPFPEAREWPKLDPHEYGLVSISDWEKRPVDLKRPDRVVKGYGSTRSPQLHIFAHLGDVDAVRALLESNADPDKLDPERRSALLRAIEGGSDACVMTLLPLTSPKAINTRTKMGNTCLHEAISARQPNWVKALIDCGANVDLPGMRGQTPLFEAIAHFSTAAKMKGSMLDQEAVKNGLKSIPHAWRPSTSPFVKDQEAALSNLFMKYDYLADTVFKEGMKDCGDNPISREIVMVLLDAGVDVAKVMPGVGFTALLFAAEIGNEWLLETLIEHGANIRDQLSDGSTVYRLLNGYGHYEYARRFLAQQSVEDRLWLRETIHKNSPS